MLVMLVMLLMLFMFVVLFMLEFKGMFSGECLCPQKQRNKRKRKDAAT